MVVGGAQETAKYTAEHFHRHGDDVLFVKGPETGREGELLLDPGLRVVTIDSLVRRISPWNDLRALWALYRLFRRERPDIVHARISKVRVLVPIAARLARVPVVVQTIHGFSFGNQIDRLKWLYVLLEKMVVGMYDFTIVVSEGDLAEGTQLVILRDVPLQLIRSGVNVDKITAADPAASANLRAGFAPAGEPVVTLIGRLISPKTPEVFVDAAARVLKSNPDARFVIVGDGPKREEIAAQIARLGVGDRVLMLGLRQDVPEIISASDIIVHSSIREGLPKTVLEGMAAGKAVIGTNVGGVPAVVEPGVNGLLVEPEDAAGLAAALLQLLGDAPLRERLARSALQRVQDFSLARSIDETDRLYDRLLQERKRVSAR